MNKNALIIIAKYPEIESVKTRLKGEMSDKERLGLYVSLLNSTVAKLEDIHGVDTFIAFAPEHAGGYFARFNVRLIPLHDGDLGDRMFEAFSDVFKKGYQKAALVGADIPDLTPEISLKAFDLLSGHDLVFGPAADGGYYLVGMRKLIREVFENVPWSSDQTLRQSLTQAGQFAYTTGFTETLSDIDTIEDVIKMGLLKGLEEKFIPPS